MSTEERIAFAHELRRKLATRRDVFIVDRYFFEKQSEDPAVIDGRKIGYTDNSAHGPSKKISPATLRLMLDYCESDWPMDFVTYCAGMFQGRLPNEGETAFDLLPDVQNKMSADRLGFGHIYGGD